MKDGEEATIDAEAASRTADAPLSVEAARPIETTVDFATLPVIDRANYVVGNEIARGGVGRVVQARDRRLGRNVAIKELQAKNRDRAARFEREARITAQLQHPSIIHVYEAGTWPGGEPFYAMNHVAGRSLDQVAAEKKTLKERLGLLRNVITAVDALAHAHSKHIIHRDLKPSNVLIGDFGETVVIDWGLAKDRSRPAPSDEPAGARPPEPDGSPLETAHGSVVGTPGYMPPEQARGEPVDERADVYSLGAMLYHVLVGAAPYTGSSSDQVLARVLVEPPPRIRDRAPEVPIDLAAIVEKAMDRDLTKRYANAGELSADLKNFDENRLVAAREYRLRERAWRFVVRYKLWIGFATVLAIVGGFSLARVIAARNEADDRREEAEHRRAVLLLEQGRSQFVSGHSGRALVYLEEALALGEDNPVTRFLIAEARRAFAPQRASFKVGGAIQRVAMLPDGKHVAISNDLGRVALWNRDGSGHRDLLVHHYGTRTLSHSRDGVYFATAGEGAVAQLWDLRSGTWKALDHQKSIYSVEFTSDGSRAITASLDGSARVWDTATASCVLEVRPAEQTPVSLARPSHDGKRLLTLVADRLDVWPMVASTCASFTPPKPRTYPSFNGIPVFQGHDLVDATFSPDDTMIATASFDGTVKVVDAITQAPVMTIGTSGGAGSVKHVEFSPDGTLLLASGSRIARVWRVGSAGLTLAYELVGHDDVIEAAMFSRDGKWIATSSRDLSVRLWDARTGLQRAVFEGHAGSVDTIGFDSEGRTLASGSADGTVRLWDLTTLELPVIGALPEPTTALAARGTDHAAARASDCAIAMIAGRLLRVGRDHVATLGTAPLDGPHACAVAASHDQTKFAVGGTDGKVRVYRADGTLTATLQGHRKDVIAVEFSRDDGQLLSAADDQTAIVWHLASNTHEVPFELRKPIRAVAFAPDGNAIAIASDESTRIYRLGSGSSLPLDGPRLPIAWLGYSTDGTRLVTESGDRELRIWDASSGKLLARRPRGVDATGLAPLTDDVVRFASGRAVYAEAMLLDRSTAGELRQFVAEQVPWRLVDDVAIRTMEDKVVPVEPFSSTNFVFETTPVGRPLWHVADVIQYSSEIGSKADEFAKFEDEAARILKDHEFSDANLVWGPARPHAPPYDGELVRGLGHPVQTRYKHAEWAPPYGINLMFALAANRDAPQGKTSDFALGPMIPNEKYPLQIDGELRRDGFVADPDCDSMYPAATVFDPSYQGYSHMIILLGSSAEFLSPANQTGSFFWHFRILDSGGEGWNVSIGPLFVE